MEVDDDTAQPIESTQESLPPQSPKAENDAIPPSSPPSKAEPSQTVQESSSSPIVISSPDEDIRSQTVDESDSQPEVVAVHDAAVVSAAAADTTTTTPAIAIDNEWQAVDTSAAVQSEATDAGNGEPIDLASSPSSDIEQQKQKVTNSQTTITQSDAIVDLDTSSNEGEDVKEVTSQKPTQGLDSLDLELINSDSSSHSENEVQIADIPPPKQNVQDPPIVTTSNVQSDVVEIVDTIESSNGATSAVAVAANSLCANELSQNLVESTNHQKPLEIPENICTITGNTIKCFIQKNFY